MQVIGSGNTSRSWFPGTTYVPIVNLQGIEVHPAPVERREVTEQVNGVPRRRRVTVRRRVEVQVARNTTLHGTPAELVKFARLVLRVAIEADPSLVERPADRQESPLHAA